MVSMASPVAAADESDERAPDLGLRSSLGSVSVDGKRKRAVRRASIGGGRPPLKGLTADVRKEQHSYYPRRRSSSDGEMPTPTNMSLSGMTYKPKKTTTGARKQASSLAAGDETVPLSSSDNNDVSGSWSDRSGSKAKKASSRRKSSSRKMSDPESTSTPDGDRTNKPRRSSRKMSEGTATATGPEADDEDPSRTTTTTTTTISDAADALLSGSSDLETDGAKKSKLKSKSSSSSSRKKSKSSRSKKTSRKGLDDSLKLEKRKRSSQRTSESANSNSNSNYSGSDDTSGDEFESDLRARRLSGVSRTSSKSSSRDVTSALARSDSALVRWDDEDEDEDKGKDRPADGELKLKSELKSKWKSESAPTLLPDESDATMTATAATSTSTSTSTMALIKARRMGKQPSPSSFSEPTGSSVNSADALSAAMGKLPQSFTESGKTASDGSRPANKGRISFADEHVGDDEKETSASDDRRRRSENDPSPSTAKPSILKTRFSGQVNSSPSPSSGTSSRPPLPSESETTSFNKSSLTRTKVQRKTSFSDPAAAASDTERNNHDRDRDHEHELTTSLVSSLVGTITKRHKQLRRSKMSMENQIYVPPKSRRKSIFQAMAHVMAGRTVELVMWTYGASFGKVMLFFLAFYVVNIFVWAGVIDLVDQTMSGGDCIHGDDAASLTATARYELAFELSWSTFTTVGYGAVSPPGGETGCYAIRLVCAFVAFMGILFGSTTAAIMYSKLMRLIAQAHVTFSSTLCVQYGKGAEGGTVRYGQLNFRASLSVQAYNKKLEAALLANGSETNGGKHTADDTPAGSEDGYPVIEFRMMNDRANHEGSEIWDAQISAIVQLHKEQTGTSAGALKNDKVSGGGSTLDLEKKVYYPITLSPNTHPHFSRIWYARHVLNEESPLLKREVRDMIAAEKQWDPDFNSWREIRDCLNPFISLRVTLSGTSAVSASTVFAEHVYEFDDVCVGWRFANMVYEKKVGIYNRSWWRRFGRPFGLPGESVPTEGQDDNPDMKTKVDRDLLHDIVPQPGGDFEPMEDDTDSVFHIFSI